MKFIFILIIGLTAGLAKANTTHPTEIIVGRDKAIVTLYEYGSLTCHVCARFATSVKDELFTKFGDKLRIVMRPFPFNKIDIEGFKLVLCSKDPVKYSTAIYKKQDDLFAAKDQVEAVKDIVKGLGMTSHEIQKCLENKQLEQQIIMRRQLLKADVAPILKIGKIKISGLPKTPLLKKLIEEAIQYVEAGGDISTFTGSEKLRRSLDLKPLENDKNAKKITK